MILTNLFTRLFAFSAFVNFQIYAPYWHLKLSTIHLLHDANISFLIYSHIPIIVGLIVITVSMSFLVSPSVNHLFATSFFYFGIAIFHWATLANSIYNMDDFKFPKCYYALQIALYLCGLLLSLLLSKNPDAVILITSIISLCQTGIFVVYFVKKKPDYDLFWYIKTKHAHQKSCQNWQDSDCRQSSYQLRWFRAFFVKLNLLI